MVGIIICTALLTAIVIGVIYVSTKSSRMRDTMFHRYYIIEELWLKTALQDSLRISYTDRSVDIKIERNYLAGTNKNCQVYSAFINNIECATAVKLRDKYNCYYTFYVDEQFDEKEVWDILDTAYKRAEEQRKLEKVIKESTKRSVLGERQ